MSDSRPALVLTGASRGIGHATVKRFSKAGWRVITCSRHPFSDRCPWPMGPEDHIQVDLSDPDNLGVAVAEIRNRLGPQGGKLQALVNNAGISPKDDQGQRLDSLTTPMYVWRTVFQVNFFAPIMLARGLFRELKAAGGSVTELPADTLVFALGLRPDRGKIEPLLDVIPESYLVGDCNGGGRIFDANQDAFNVAVEV